MKQFAKRLLMVGGAILVTATVANLLAPRVAHAVTALLVQVTNTVANPVLNRDVDNPVRQAVQLRATGFFSGNTIASSNFTTFDGTDFVVPAGKRLVVEFISGDMNVPQGVSITDVVFFGVVTTPNGNDSTSVELAPAALTGPGNLQNASVGNHYVFSQSLRVYSDSGSDTHLDIILSGSGGLGFFQACLEGYLVDCVDGCLPTT